MRVSQTRKRIAESLSMDPRTLTKRLAEIGINHSRALMPIEVDLITQKIGTREQLDHAARQLGIGA